jgi:hypothetical protein
MRRAIFLTVASMTVVLTLPAVHLDAVCSPVPSASSAEGAKAIRAANIVVWGTVEPAVPADAHAAHSFFLKVKGYFRGAGPSRVEVSDYSDGDIPAQSLVAGASIDAAREFIRHFRGQDAIVFATKAGAPYLGQFTTNACGYTAYGDAATADLLPVLRRIFGNATSPVLSATGPGGVVGLAAAAALLIACGAGLQAATRGWRSRS